MNKLTEWVGNAVILRWSIVAAIVLAAMIWGYFIITENAMTETPLPVMGPVNDDGTAHQISSFSLINQDGITVTQDNFKDKIYVADFFFTTCEGICPRMSNQMERIAKKYKDNSDVLMISHTVKPEEDSISVLKSYANLHEADPTKWFFVTGRRNEINSLARKSYMLAGNESGDSSDFVHTQIFALVDKHRHIRGYYDGTDTTDVNKLMSDIGILENEK